QDGYCVSYSPGVTATCSAGDPVTSGVRIVAQGTDEVPATVWETAPEVEQIIVSWAGANNVARVVHPWSGSAAGFAAVILPEPNMSFTYYSEDANGRGVDSGAHAPSTQLAAQPVSASAVAWIPDPATVPADWNIRSATEPTEEGRDSNSGERVTTLLHY